jgi:hypothetical protein
MNQSIVRFPKNPLVTGLAVTTRCVEYGFITVGATAAAFSALESVVIVLSWIKVL